MNSIQTYLQGKKTYAVGIVLALYGLGAYFGLWKFDLSVVSALGGGGLLTLAAKVERLLSDDTTPAQPSSSVTQKASLIAFLLLPALLFVGCASNKLEVGGAYAPATFQVVTNGSGGITTNVVQTVQPDLAFYAADATFDLSYSTLDGVFKFERDNRAMLWSLSPNIKHTLDSIRPTAWQVVQRYTAARAAYMANPTPVGLSLLQDAASKIQALAAAAQAATATVTTNK